MNSIGGLSNKEFSEMVRWFDTRRLSSGLLFRGLSKCIKIFRGLFDVRGCLVGFKNKKLLF